MIRTIRKRCACVALLFLGVAGSACGKDTVSSAMSMQVVPTAADLDDVAGLEQFIDGVMAASAGPQQVSGAVLSIVKDGKVLFAKGYGHADLAHGTPVDPRTSMFRIGSVTKLFTWTAVMQLVEQGQLDLDADVNSYLKSFQLPNTYPAPITLRHLLTHTAGFEEGFLGYVIVTDPKDAQRPMAEVLANHMPARVRPPGTMPSYSNYGAALAGLIVEQVSGLPYNDYVQRHIFDSLRMTHSTFEQQPLLSDAVIGYGRENGDYVTPPYEYIGGFRPCGGASASALDMARFMLAYLHGGEYQGGRILRAETIQQMRAPQFQLDERFAGIPLGSYLWKKNGLDAYGHGGDMKLFRTSLTLIPERQLGIFMSFAGPGGAAAREELTTAFLDRYFPAQPAQPVPASAAAHDVAKYAGSYQWARRNHSKIDKAFGLLSQIAVSVLPNNRLLVTSPDLDAPMQFAPLGADLFQQVGGSSQLAFRTDQSGGVTHMFFDFASFMPAERTPWHETSGLWFTLLGVSLLILLSALTGVLYGWRQIQSLPNGPRRALWLSAAAAGCVFLTVIAAIVVLSVHGETFFNHIPFSFKVVLALPLLFVAMTLALVGAAILAWRNSWWQIARRVHFTLVTLSAMILSLFFWQWNLLGWQFG